LVPRGIFSEFDPFRDLFDSPLRLTRVFGEPLARDLKAGQWAPAMDIVEHSNGYVVTLELAGASKDDVTIECHDNMLTVKGEKQSESEHEDEHQHYTERSYGAFSRSVRLPADAADDVKASFNNGVLKIEIPKVEERKPRVVAIEGS
jgi:HSP20 family protein